MFDDLKFAWRRLRHAPGFALIAVFTLALAIGANTAIFSIADVVLFRPLPYQDPDRVFLLQLMNRVDGGRSTRIAYPYVQAIHDHHRGLGEVGMSDAGPAVVATTADGAERVSTLAVTANYFQVLGARAARGRLFDSQDAVGTGRTAVLSYASWRQRFGGDDRIIGHSVTLGTATFDVIGVLPAGFVLPILAVSGARPEIITLIPQATFVPNYGTFYPVVRLEPGVTREQAQAEMDAIVKPLATAGDPRSANSLPVLDDIRSVMYPTGRPIMGFLVASAALVLLIGCANLASMLLARSKRSERELGVRGALGAGWIRLVRPVIFEAAIIGLSGSVLAVFATVSIFDLLLRQVPSTVYRTAPVGVDLRVMLFTLGMGLFAGLVFSAVPAWRASRVDAQAMIQGRQQRSSLWRMKFGRPLVAVQVALAIVLVFGAVVASRAFLSVLRVPLGFDAENVIGGRIRPSGMDGPALQAFYARAIETLAQRSDVVSVGAAGSLPFDGAAPDDAVRTETRQMLAGLSHVLPGYFEAFRIPLIRGRLLNSDDVRDNPEAAVVSESAGRSLFSGGDPLGATFKSAGGRSFTVVGVVADIKRSLDQESPPAAYIMPPPARQNLTLVVRTRTRQEAALREIKQQISALAPGSPFTPAWWSDSISNVNAYRNPRFQTMVLGTFAALALGLTALGIFGVIAFLVALRTKEIGIRAALGATPRSLAGLMLREAFVPAIAGVLISLVVIRWARRLAEAQLFKVDTHDPVTLAAAVVTVIVVALVAAYLPARRASRIDPIVVLKTN